MLPFLKRPLLVILLVAFLVACASAKSPGPTLQIANSSTPQTGDGTMVRGNVEIVKTELLPLGSVPSKFTLKISFFLPTPCDQYRIVVDQPTADNRINVEVYSLMPQGKVCTLMRLNTPTEAKLILGNLSSGHYTIWVNGAKALEVDA